MKKYTISHYLRDLKDVTRMYEEGLITEGEFLIRIHDISVRIAVVKRTELQVKLTHAKRELELISQLLG